MRTHKFKLFLLKDENNKTQGKQLVLITIEKIFKQNGLLINMQRTKPTKSLKKLIFVRDK